MEKTKFHFFMSYFRVNIAEFHQHQRGIHFPCISIHWADMFNHGQFVRMWERSFKCEATSQFSDRILIMRRIWYEYWWSLSITLGCSMLFAVLRLRPRSHRTRSTLQPHMQIMEHTAVNGSVHIGCKQHQRVCMQICFGVLCEWGLTHIYPFGNAEGS